MVEVFVQLMLEGLSGAVDVSMQSILWYFGILMTVLSSQEVSKGN